ncbi:hypothetical protein [Pseudalkalibacillus hwajinpoensis]|uniref:hypothetical protein n=1 Tax=Guptibacillus hwajinpoensis TaxID=208199 RepID=UPI00384F51B6
MVIKKKVVATVSTEITELVKRNEGELSILMIQNSLLQNELAQLKVQLDKNINPMEVIGLLI